MRRALAMTGFFVAASALASMPPRHCLEYETIDAGAPDSGSSAAELTSDSDGGTDGGAIDAGQPSIYYPPKRCVRWSEPAHWNEGGCSAAAGAPFFLLAALALVRRRRG